MSDTTTYNGHANYNTWAVSLWIDNEESSQRYWRTRAAECYRDAEESGSIDRLSRATFDLEDALKAEFDDAWQDRAEAANITGTMWMDLMGSALQDVNWREIAEGMLDAFDKTELDEIATEDGDD